MRALMLEIPSSLLAERRRLGHDRWDEMWEGELHMVPAPHERHQRHNDKIGVFFEVHWERLGCGRTYPETGVRQPGTSLVNVAGEDVPSAYKVPDRSFLLPDRYQLVQDGWIVGGPNAVLEIVSPGDESRAKLPFYFSIGVREVVFVDRDTLEVEVVRAGPTGFERVAADARGWVRSEVLETELRRERDEEGPNRLHLRRTGEPAREMFLGD